ncbi:MAG: hypothetical protein AAGA30_06280, partial [Planctomycetota bacterium]
MDLFIVKTSNWLVSTLVVTTVLAAVTTRCDAQSQSSRRRAGQVKSVNFPEDNQGSSLLDRLTKSVNYMPTRRDGSTVESTQKINEENIQSERLDSNAGARRKAHKLANEKLEAKPQNQFVGRFSGAASGKDSTEHDLAEAPKAKLNESSIPVPSNLARKPEFVDRPVTIPEESILLQPTPLKSCSDDVNRDTCVLRSVIEPFANPTESDARIGQREEEVAVTAEVSRNEKCNEAAQSLLAPPRPIVNPENRSGVFMTLTDVKSDHFNHHLYTNLPVGQDDRAGKKLIPFGTQQQLDSIEFEDFDIYARQEL